MAFPSLRALGLRLPLVSNAVVRDIGAAFAASAQDVAETQPIASLGAAPPEGAQFVLGSIVDMATATAAVAAGPPALAPAGTINLLPARRLAGALPGPARHLCGARHHRVRRDLGVRRGGT